MLKLIILPNHSLLDVKLILTNDYQVERYDPLKCVWTAVTPMLTKRCRLGVTTLNDKVYVCGGYDGATFLQSVEMYDPTTDK